MLLEDVIDGLARAAERGHVEGFGGAVRALASAVEFARVELLAAADALDRLGEVVGVVERGAIQLGVAVDARDVGHGVSSRILRTCRAHRACTRRRP